MDIENFDFKSYLIKIGLDEKYAKMPAVIEILKLRLKEIKEDDEFEISDTGIFYKDGIIRYDNGKFRISPNSFFTEKNGMYVYIEDEFSKYVITVLDSFGTVSKIISSKKHSFSEELEKTMRIFELDTPIIEFVTTYNDEDIIQEFIADLGDPIRLKSNIKSFEENYNYYTRKYPELKKWYEERYNINNKSIEDYSNELYEKQNDLNIRLLNEQIERFDGYIKKAKEKENEYQKKLSDYYDILAKGNIIKKILYKPLVKNIKEELKKIEEKNRYKINSNDEKLLINHEKLEEDYTNPLSEKEKKIEDLKNMIIDKKLELQKKEKNISEAIKKIEIIKLKLDIKD